MATRLIAINTTRGARVTQGGPVAKNPLTRLVGLLGSKSLEFGDGLWIVPCDSIHSFFMKFPFDAVFLDKNLKVVHLIREMKAWRISPLVFSAHSVLEVPAGITQQTATRIGDQFEMREEKA